MGDQYGSQTLGKIVIDFSQKYIDKTLAELEEERAGVAHLLG
jgi:hypothetical protein